MPLIAEYARRFGIYDDMLPVLSMALGAGETTVMRQVTTAIRCSRTAAGASSRR